MPTVKQLPFESDCINPPENYTIMLKIYTFGRYKTSHCQKKILYSNLKKVKLLKYLRFAIEMYGFFHSQDLTKTTAIYLENDNLLMVCPGRCFTLNKENPASKKR